MTPRRPRFDVREASSRIALVLGALLVANVAVAILFVRPKLAEYRQLTDESSPHLQVVKTREKDVLAKRS